MSQGRGLGSASLPFHGRGARNLANAMALIFHAARFCHYSVWGRKEGPQVLWRLDRVLHILVEIDKVLLPVMFSGCVLFHETSEFGHLV